jgi:hypothetical protein
VSSSSALTGAEDPRAIEAARMAAETFIIQAIFREARRRSPQDRKRAEEIVTELVCRCPEAIAQLRKAGAKAGLWDDADR